MADFREPFFVSLLSNVSSSHLFHYNTIGNFITRLQKKIILNGEWEVALFKILYTKSWYNIRESFEIKIVTENGKTVASGQLPEGVYNNENTIISSVNHKLTKMSKDGEKELFTPPKIQKNNTNNVIVVRLGKRNDESLYPFFNDGLVQLLGLEDAYDDFAKSPNKNIKKVKGHVPVDIGLINTPIFVYCDIVYPSLVGDKCTKLLRIVENKAGAFGEQVFHEFQHLQYHRLAVKEFDTIEIDVKDEYNNTLPFKFGRTIVTLHFRKRDELYRILP